MRQIPDYSDERNKGFCIHCGTTSVETRDHVPSKVLLDDPLPDNLPVAPSCGPCNNSFSLDEQYLACLLECVLAGSADPDRIERPKIAMTLAKNVGLATMLKDARREVRGQIVWVVADERVRNIVLKLARCHVAFELNEPQFNEPDKIWFRPLLWMTDEEREEFEDGYRDFAAWPEVGSRAMNRLLIGGADVLSGGWLVVQDGRYRYNVSQDDGNRVRMVIREYLACEVVWC